MKVHAVSVNLSDWEFLIGQPLYTRVYGVFRPRLKVLGSDVAGTVAAVGSEVTAFKPGDEVFGDIIEHGGGFAEYVCAPEKCWTIKPPTMSFEVASTLPQSGCIAVQGIRDMGRVQAGERVLINGAGGGSGTLAIALAKSLGAVVTGVDNTLKQEVMKRAGADHTVDYTQTDFTKSEETYDHILDLVAHRPIAHYRRALRPGGRYLMVGGSVRLMLKLLLSGPFNSRWHGKRLGVLAVTANKNLSEIAQLVEDGILTPIIDRVMPLAETADALRLVGEGKVLGKIVIKVV